MSIQTDFVKAVSEYARVSEAEADKWFHDIRHGKFQSVFYKIEWNSKWWNLAAKYRCRKAVKAVLVPEMMGNLRALEMLVLLNRLGISWDGLDDRLVVPAGDGCLSRIVRHTMEGGCSPAMAERVHKRALRLISAGL